MKSREFIDKDENVIDEITLEIMDLLGPMFSKIPLWTLKRYNSWEEIIRPHLKSHSNLYNRTLHSFLIDFFDTLVMELIETGAVFVFPQRRFVMAIAQRSMDSKKYKYDVKTKMGPPVLSIATSRGTFIHYRKSYLARLPESTYRKLEEQIKKGTKYITYEELTQHL